MIVIAYITRHGQVGVRSQTPSGRIELSDLGRKQAYKLGARLVEMGFNGAVYTSPYMRCLQTADIICEVTGLRFRPEPAIGERAMDWIHHFQGLRAEEIMAMFPRCVEDASFAWPWWAKDVENGDDVAARVGPFLDKLLAETDQDVLLVGHGASTGAMFRHLAQGQKGNGLYNAALTAIRVKPTVEVLFSGNTDHLGIGEITSNKLVIA